MNRRSFLAAPLLALLPREVFGLEPRNYGQTPKSSLAPRCYKAAPTTPSVPKSVPKPAPTRSVPTFSPCPNGQCPRRRITLGPPWIEVHLGYTSASHLINVHGWPPDVVSFYQQQGLLNHLHGSPDSPRSPHTHG